ncbi:hypothetical protein C8D95_10838 [Silicimonas algicola]|uniref:Uncharacterized protein n=1 Tax=Silicimonas algicola TaxID=1826607 RepID=A0A316G3B9_9RHOB|nr:hypothetical protein C8D95_10838 [Silicimonas algicola]
MKVVSFPAAPTQTQKATRRPARPMTLFLHVRRSTLIMHIADSRADDTSGRAEAK